MKRKLTFVLAFALGLFPVLMGAQDKEQEKRDVLASLDARRYVVEVDWAIPMSGKNISLSPGYTLEVRNDTLVVDLPFFGRATSLPYGDGGGIKLDTVLEDYKSHQITSGKNIRTEISFNAHGDDHFRFFLVVFEDGSTNISVNSNNRTPMGYRGRLVPQVTAPLQEELLE